MNDVAELPQGEQPAIHVRLRRGDALRHRAITLLFGRLFSAVGGQLCEPGQLPTRGVHRVLICRPNHRLGNTVLISPLLAEIEALYPGAEIDLVSGGEAARMLFTNRFQVRQVFCLPRKIARHVWQTIALLRQLRHNSYDLAIDACNGSQSGRLLLGIVKARFKLGFPDIRANAGSLWHSLSWPDHLARRSVFLLRTAYAGKVDRPYETLNLRLSDDERQQAGKALTAVLGGTQQAAAGRPVIGIFANATGAKRYGETWWKEFVDALQAAQPNLLIVDVIAEHGQTQLGGDFASYYTRDLRRLASMIANMDGFISADCGVMHLAVASGTPTIGLFSVTSSSKYSPYGRSNTAIDTGSMSAAQVAGKVSAWLTGTLPAERQTSLPLSTRSQ
ncbi:lipopolysaccharide heptosyltransferase family protein [Rhodanobacter glycinis]|nr:lipopolysaccharide heptosyltransferase family protein [Rhodanobacter glycinis]